MAITVKLRYLDLSNNKIWSDMDNLFPAGASSSLINTYTNVELLEETSLFTPTFLFRGNFRDLEGCNYLQYSIPAQTSAPVVNYNKIRYYIIDDIISTSLGLIKVKCHYDPLRNHNWLSSIGRLCLSTREADWVNTLDDTRFNPMGIYDYSKGATKRIINTGLAVNTDPANNTGAILMKYWCGALDTNTGNHVGTCWAFMTPATFNNIMHKIVNWLAEDLSHAIPGIDDFTKFIYNVKYFPSFELGKLPTQINSAEEAGYTYNSWFTIGGYCSLDNVDIWLKMNMPGFLDGGNQSINLKTYLGADTMQFLMSDRWSNAVIQTPIGSERIPLDAVNKGGDLRYRVIINTDLGIITYKFLNKVGNNDYDSFSEPIFEISGPCAIDLTDQVVHVQSVGEKASIVDNQIMAKAAGATTTINPTTFAKNVSGLVSSLGGRAQQVYASGSQVWMRGSSTNPDFTDFVAMGRSLGIYNLKTYIHLNPDTPIWDDRESDYYLTHDWKPDRLETIYKNWCKDISHGFPSNKYRDVGGTSTSTNAFVQFSEVTRVQYDLVRPSFRLYDKAPIAPGQESAIIAALLNGVTLINNAST